MSALWTNILAVWGVVAPYYYAAGILTVLWFSGDEFINMARKAHKEELKTELFLLALIGVFVIACVASWPIFVFVNLFSKREGK